MEKTIEKISGNNFIACAIFNIAKKDSWVKNVVYQSWETTFSSKGEETSAKGLGKFNKNNRILRIQNQ